MPPGSGCQVTILFSNDGARLYAAETGRDRVTEVALKAAACFAG